MLQKERFTMTDKTALDGGEAIVQAFRDLGVDYVFSSPGSEWSPLWEAWRCL